jgi:hypothetical protein
MLLSKKFGYIYNFLRYVMPVLLVTKLFLKNSKK